MTNVGDVVAISLSLLPNSRPSSTSFSIAILDRSYTPFESYSYTPLFHHEAFSLNILLNILLYLQKPLFVSSCVNLFVLVPFIFSLNQLLRRLIRSPGCQKVPIEHGLSHRIVIVSLNLIQCGIFIGIGGASLD